MQNSPGPPNRTTQPANQERAKLESRASNGANWFFWIVELSGINTLIIMFGGEWNFLIGLGITQLVAAVAEELAWSPAVSIITFMIVGGILALCGYFARKRSVWGFAVGAVLYGIDALLFLWVQDWLSLGFHALALYFIINGAVANDKLKKLKTETGFQQSTF